LNQIKEKKRTFWDSLRHFSPRLSIFSFIVVQLL
jgi:hypothetical protein